MKPKLIFAAAALSVALATGIALAQMQMPGNMPMMPGHGAMHGGAAVHGDQGPSSLAFQAANEKMHRDMAITYTGDADRDFVTGMIAHHQGAVDVAKIVIAFGKDSEVRKLAEGIVKAQEEEIAWMKTWLQKNSH